MKKTIVIVVFLISLLAAQSSLAAGEISQRHIPVYEAATDFFGPPQEFIASVHEEESLSSRHPDTYKDRDDRVVHTVGAMQVSWLSHEGPSVMAQNRQAQILAYIWTAEHPGMNPHPVAFTGDDFLDAQDDVVSIFVAASHLKKLGANTRDDLNKLREAAAQYNGGPTPNAKAWGYADRIIARYQRYLQEYQAKVEPQDVRQIKPQVTEKGVRKMGANFQTIFVATFVVLAGLYYFWKFVARRNRLFLTAWAIVKAGWIFSNILVGKTIRILVIAVSLILTEFFGALWLGLRKSSRSFSKDLSKIQRLTETRRKAKILAARRKAIRASAPSNAA